MTKASHCSAPELSGEQIAAVVAKRLQKYRHLNFFEQFSMFMGVAQILEFALKGLLCRRFGFDLKATERWTLGRTAKTLKEKGVRTDFVVLLESVVNYRNYIAHELLANDAVLKSLLPRDAPRFEVRKLEKGIIELEQLMFLFEWTEENQAW